MNFLLVDFFLIHLKSGSLCSKHKIIPFGLKVISMIHTQYVSYKLIVCWLYKYMLCQHHIKFNTMENAVLFIWWEHFYPKNTVYAFFTAYEYDPMLAGSTDGLTSFFQQTLDITLACSTFFSYLLSTCNIQFDVLFMDEKPC